MYLFYFSLRNEFTLEFLSEKAMTCVSLLLCEWEMKELNLPTQKWPLSFGFQRVLTVNSPTVTARNRIRANSQSFMTWKEIQGYTV